MEQMTNSDVVRRVYQALNDRDHEAFHTLVARDYVNHEGANMGVSVRGPQNWSQVLARLGASFPDIAWRVLRTVEVGDQVWAEAVMSGTHRGRFFHWEPTGATFEVRQVHMHRVADGQIREHSAVRDDLGVLTQLGLVESPAPAQAAR